MREYSTNVNQIIRWLWLFILILSVLNIAVIYKIHFLPQIDLYGLEKLFHFDRERNFPTYFSALLIILNALLFYLLYSNNTLESKNKAFLLLCWIFMFIAFDEVFVLHGKTVKPIREYFQLGGFFYFAWLIPYILATLLLAIFLIPFLLKLPGRYRRLYLISGAMYIFGAVVLEMFEGRHYQIHQADFTFHVYTTVEELLEMVGMTICIFTSLTYLQQSTGGLRVTVNSEQLE